MLSDGSVSAPPAKKPDWLKRPPGSASETRELKKLLRKSKLNTVCEEARCPNISECFSRGTATFMILGDVCTRGCRFCSVTTGRPIMPSAQFAAEGERVAEAAEALGLSHVVITSVARDDLEDGGASGFAKSVAAVRERLPDSSVEVLVPDFRGSFSALHVVLDASPDVFNHNLETVPRLYRRVRPGASYRRSLDLLQEAKRYAPRVITKTGVMLGLGEEPAEVLSLMDDCRSCGVESFTAGQYMQPTRRHLAVEDYVTPDMFEYYESEACKRGFTHIAVGPLVRSSYHADEYISK